MAGQDQNDSEIRQRDSDRDNKHIYNHLEKHEEQQWASSLLVTGFRRYLTPYRCMQCTVYHIRAALHTDHALDAVVHIPAAVCM